MRWDDPARDGEYMGMTRDAVTGLKPWTGHGVYVNILPAATPPRPLPPAPASPASPMSHIPR